MATLLPAPRAHKMSTKASTLEAKVARELSNVAEQIHYAVSVGEFSILAYMRSDVLAGVKEVLEAKGYTVTEDNGDLIDMEPVSNKPSLLRKLANIISPPSPATPPAPRIPNNHYLVVKISW